MMSAICGLFRPDGGPINTAHLAAVGDALGPFGPDGSHVATRRDLGMIHRPFHTVPSARFERQPVVSADDDWLAWEGRLDNRADLVRELGDGTSPSSSTPELVLAAYRRWGLPAFGRLLGDFALALWDARTARLVLARDPFGMRPLFVHRSADGVAWASRPRALVDGLALDGALDEGYLASFILNLPSDHSPFSGIESVPPAHALVVDRDGSRLERYWRPDPAQTIRYRDDREYEDHFNEIFDDAVACRMDAIGPVFAELSGGIDSSSIVCVGDKLSAARGGNPPPARTASYVFSDATSSDERAYIDAVESQRGQLGLHIDVRDYPILSPVSAAIRPDFPTNQLCFLARHDHLASVMRQAGGRVLLSGLCGDAMFWGELPDPPIELADLVQERRWLDLLRGTYRWSRLSHEPFFKTLWQGTVWPSLPRRWQARTQVPPRLGPWLDPRFVDRANLVERRIGLEADTTFPLPSQTMQYGMIRSSIRVFALERCLTHDTVEMRYPYLDRRIIEFGLATPLSQKLRGGDTRSVVRRALRGVLPEAIRTRETKAGPAEAFHRAIGRQWPYLQRLFASPRCADLGLIEPRIFLEELQRARHGMVGNLVQMMRTISLELWLRTLDSNVESRAASAPSFQPAATLAAPSHTQRRTR